MYLLLLDSVDDVSHENASSLLTYRIGNVLNDGLLSLIKFGSHKIDIGGDTMMCSDEYLIMKRRCFHPS